MTPFIGVLSVLLFFVFLIVTINPKFFLGLVTKKQLNVSRKHTLLAAGLSFILFVVMVMQPTEEPKEVPAEVTSPVQEEKPEAAPATVEPKPIAPIMLNDYAPWIVEQVAGVNSNIEGQKRVRSVEVSEQSVFIDITADDNFTKSTVKSDILDKSTQIFKRVFNERQDVPKLFLSWNLPLNDVQGNTSMDPVIVISLTAEDAKKINWDNFTYSNLPAAASSYTEHAALRQ